MWFCCNSVHWKKCGYIFSAGHKLYEGFFFFFLARRMERSAMEFYVIIRTNRWAKNCYTRQAKLSSQPAAFLCCDFSIHGRHQKRPAQACCPLSGNRGSTGHLVHTAWMEEGKSSAKDGAKEDQTRIADCQLKVFLKRRKGFCTCVQNNTYKKWQC